MTKRSRKRRKFTRQICVCRHEAAHAIVGEYLGQPVKEMKVTSKDTGHTRFQRDITDPLAMGIILSAGHAAEMRWHRKSSRYISAGDGRMLKKAGFKPHSLGTLLALARTLVEMHIEAIETCAQALKMSDLTGRDVRRIFRSLPARVP